MKCLDEDEYILILFLRFVSSIFWRSERLCKFIYDKVCLVSQYQRKKGLSITL